MKYTHYIHETFAAPYANSVEQWAKLGIRDQLEAKVNGDYYAKIITDPASPDFDEYASFGWQSERLRETELATYEEIRYALENDNPELARTWVWAYVDMLARKAASDPEFFRLMEASAKLFIEDPEWSQEQDVADAEYHRLLQASAEGVLDSWGELNMLAWEKIALQEAGRL